MQEIKNIPADMVKAAKELKTGLLICVYRDGNIIRAETEQGEDPYVWRKGKWYPMR